MDVRFGSSLIPRPPANETVPCDVLYAHMQGHPGAKGDPGIRGTIGERVSKLFAAFRQVFPNSLHSPLLHRVDRETKVFRDIQGSLDTQWDQIVWPTTVDREIFTLKIIRVKNFRVVKFSRSCSIREIFLTVDDCNMNERLKSSWRLVYYQVSGEPGIAPCSRRSDI